MPPVRVWLRVWADAVGYAVAVAAVAVVAAVVVGVATGGGLVRAKVLLFVGGWTLLAYATVRLWPRSVEDADERGRSLPGTAEPTRFRAIVRSLPPLRWMRPPPPARRLRPPAKLFLGAIFVLLASLAMEVVFGI